MISENKLVLAVQDINIQLQVGVALWLSKVLHIDDPEKTQRIRAKKHIFLEVTAEIFTV